MRLRIFTATLLISASPSVSNACTCSNGGPRSAMRGAMAVFLGRVVSTAPRRQGSVGEIRVALFRVTSAIKGAKSEEIREVEYLVNTGGNCGLTLARGMNLLVYAISTRAGQTLSTDSCEGTKLQECAAPDLRALGVAVPRGSRDCNPAPGRGAARSLGDSSFRARYFTNA